MIGMLGLLATLSAADAAPARVYTLEHDMRMCMAPLCGGWWVREVNSRKTRCADGTRADACYVAEVDYTALGLSQTDLDKIQGALDFVLLGGRNELQNVYGWDLGVLVVERAWLDLSY